MSQALPYHPIRTYLQGRFGLHARLVGRYDAPLIEQKHPGCLNCHQPSPQRTSVLDVLCASLPASYRPPSQPQTLSHHPIRTYCRGQHPCKPDQLTGSALIPLESTEETQVCLSTHSTHLPTAVRCSSFLSLLCASLLAPYEPPDQSQALPHQPTRTYCKDFCVHA